MVWVGRQARMNQCSRDVCQEIGEFLPAIGLKKTVGDESLEAAVPLVC